MLKGIDVIYRDESGGGNKENAGRVAAVVWSGTTATTAHY